MRYRTKRRIQGSISLLLVIILLPTMVLSGIIVDASRVNMAKSMVSSAGDLAVNSMLANYDTILKDVYGLFAVSQDDPAVIEANIKEYFEDTLVSYGVTNEAGAESYVQSLMGNFKGWISGTNSVDVSNFMDMEVLNDFKVEKVSGSGLDNPDILRKQIVDYMKYRAPVNVGLSIFDSIKAFTAVKEQTKVVKAQVEAQESLQPVTEGCRVSIDLIREFDEMVLEMDEGTKLDGTSSDKAVKGISSSGDTGVVKVLNYGSQVDKYKREWGENLEYLNQLNLIFFVKAPDITSYYLSQKSFNANDFFIKEDDSLDTNNCGISADSLVINDYDTAKNGRDAIYTELKKEEAAGGVYQKLVTDYCAADYMKRLLMNVDKNDFDNEESAVDAFITFEKFLLNDETAQIKYRQVKDVLEKLYFLDQYEGKYREFLDKKIEDKEAEKVEAKNNLDHLTAELTSIVLALNIAEDATNRFPQAEAEKDVAEAALNAAKAAVSTAETAKDTAETAMDTAKGVYDAAQAALDACKAPTTSSVYRGLKSTRDTAKTAYDSATEVYNDAKAAYDTAVSAKDAAQTAYNEKNTTYLYCLRNKKSQSELQSMRAERSRKEQEEREADELFRRLRTELESLQAEKTSDGKDYPNLLSKYKPLTRDYQQDLEIYGEFQTIARLKIERDLKAITDQFQKIGGNIEALFFKLNEIGTALSELKLAIEDYSNNVTKWQTANNNYVAGNDSDSFSEQNNADIKATKDQYNIETLKTLQDCVKSITEEYDTLYSTLINEDLYKYGTKRIDQMQSQQDMKDAVPAAIKDALPSLVTKEVASQNFDLLYTTTTTPDLVLDKLTFVERGVLPLHFLKYLNENYPKEARTIETKDKDGNPTDPKKDYDKLKEDMESNKSGEKSISGGADTGSDGKNAFGYTYESIKSTDIDQSVLPSKNADKKTGNTSSMKFKNNDETVNASDGLEEQGKQLDSILANVGKILETGMENAYLLDYIFENFSYNTMVQEQFVKGENITNLPGTVGMATHSKLPSYKGKAKTLSNYSICGANNYMYGAEIEYLMYGNLDPKENVKYTKGSIYAVRFAFNCIFAFTDSEIRNTTRAAGLAVQAATLGFVPYQVVQIVLQLALAAGESAIDLDSMSKGLSVVVIKTKDTWNLSVRGAINTVSAVIENTATSAITAGVQKATQALNTGINKVLDASADTLNSAVGDLSNTLDTAAKAKAQEIIDSVYTQVVAEVENALNQLQIAEFSSNAQADVTDKIDQLFAEAESRVDAKVQEISDANKDNPVVVAVMQFIPEGEFGYKTKMGDMKDLIQSKIDDAFAQANGAAVDVVSSINGCMTKVRFDVINTAQNAIDETIKSAELVVKGSITEVKDKISTSVTQWTNAKAEEVTEELVEKVKGEVVDALNGFSDKYLSGSGTNLGKANPTDKSVSTMLKFGYRDYLMLMLFASICVKDEPVLQRVGDLIQLNMSHATGNGEAGQLVFTHNKGDQFKLSEACTYVTVGTSVKTDMLFMKMDFFNRLVLDPAVDADTQIKGVSTLQYHGLGGY